MVNYYDPNFGHHAREYFDSGWNETSEDDVQDSSTLSRAARLLAWAMSQDFKRVEWDKVTNAVNAADWNGLRQNLEIDPQDGYEALEASFDDFMHSIIWDADYDVDELLYPSWNIFVDAYMANMPPDLAVYLRGV